MRNSSRSTYSKRLGNVFDEIHWNFFKFESFEIIQKCFSSYDQHIKTKLCRNAKSFNYSLVENYRRTVWIFLVDQIELWIRLENVPYPINANSHIFHSALIKITSYRFFVSCDVKAEKTLKKRISFLKTNLFWTQIISSWFSSLLNDENQENS